MCVRVLNLNLGYQMIKCFTEQKYNLDTIKQEVNYIIDNIGWSQENQIMLQGHDEGLGSLDWSKEKEHFTLNIPEDFIISKFIKQNNLFRTRLMMVKPKTNYSYHFDGTKRLHLSVFSNVNNFFIIEDHVYRIPSDGHPYLVDTTKYHTFVNTDKKLERIHIVGGLC